MNETDDAEPKEALERLDLVEEPTEQVFATTSQFYGMIQLDRSVDETVRELRGH